MQLSQMHGVGRINVIEETKYVTFIWLLLRLSTPDRIRGTDLLNIKILHRNFIVVDPSTNINICLKLFD